MLLILEIGLTIWACIRLGQAKKGWHLGLMPVAAGIVGGFLLGLLLGAIGVSSTVIVVIGLIIDIAIIITLIVLIVKNKPLPK